MKQYKDFLNEKAKNDHNAERTDLKDAYYNAEGALQVIKALQAADEADLKSIKIDKNKEIALWKQIEKLVDQSKIGVVL